MLIKVEKSWQFQKLNKRFKKIRSGNMKLEEVKTIKIF